jgi:hypothetical protein
MILQPSVATSRVFIPKWRDNDSADANEQIRIHYRPVTVAIKEKIIPRDFAFEQDANGNMKPSMSIRIDRKKYLYELVTKIENLGYISEDGVEIKITTVEQFFSGPVEFDGLIDEIYAFFNDLVTSRINEKN